MSGLEVSLVTANQRQPRLLPQQRLLVRVREVGGIINTLRLQLTLSELVLRFDELHSPSRVLQLHLILTRLFGSGKLLPLLRLSDLVGFNVDQFDQKSTGSASFVSVNTNSRIISCTRAPRVIRFPADDADGFNLR